MGSWDSLLSWKPPSWWDSDSDVNYPSNRRLIENAYKKAETCELCRNLLLLDEHIDVGPENVENLNASAQRDCAGCMVVCSIMLLIRHHMGDECRLDFTFRRLAWSDIKVYTRGLVFELFSPQIQDHVWKIPDLRGKPHVSLYTGSAHAIQRTQLWLRDCEQIHESCPHSNSPLPSRVLRIRGPQQVNLYESNGEKVPYACLSHCWGKEHIIRTTKATLPHHKQRILWKQLPLTFQQAISFTYRLGLKYLWIDSLCIVQDDVDDWRHEGTKMTQTYSGAYITLAATASRDASGGCFRHTPKRPILRLTYPDGKGSKSHLCIRPGIEGLGHSQHHAPLLCRAWTLQERLLSPRTLHFAHAELVWECRMSYGCECSVMDHKRSSLNDVNSSWLDHALSKGKDHVEPDIWWSVVEQYTHQRLTYERDIFPALQGISKLFSTYKRSRYLAGLWEMSLMQDLLWVHDPENAGLIKGRLKEWRAPSWSWASVLGPVSWLVRGYHTDFHPLATCTAAEVEPAGTDAFGEILSATITLRARCFPTVMQQSWIHLIEEPEHRIGTVAPNDPICKDFILYAIVYMDYRSAEVDAKRPCTKELERGACFRTVLIAKDITRLSKGQWSFRCLLLRRHDANSNTYERVALVEIKTRRGVDESMFPLDEEETLCIV